jgi:hypothetical protein
MTEVYTDEDGWEDEDDYDIHDEIDEIQDRLDEQDEIAEINSQIRAIEQAHGAAFSQDEVQHIGRLLDEQGVDPQFILDQLEPPADQFDQEWLGTVEKIQQEQGRQLADSEVQALYDASVYESDPRHVEPDAVLDLTNRKDRISLANERIAEHDPPAEAPELIEPLSEDAGPKERAQFIDHRLAGAEVDTDSYEGETE